MTHRGGDVQNFLKVCHMLFDWPFKYRDPVQNSFIRKAARKMLVKLTPGQGWRGDISSSRSCSSVSPEFDNR